jgi:hypothetical protein
MKLHSVDQKPWTNVWMHICADVDTVTGTLSVSLNGRPALNATIKHLQGGNKPTFLKGKLGIGISKVEEAYGGTRQFVGSVTNINLFFHDADKSIEDMSRSPCSHVGDFMAWTNADFDWKGPMSNDIKVEIERSCEKTISNGKKSSNTVYSLLLPTEMSWTEAQHKCNALGKATMTDINNDGELQHMVRWVKETRSSCLALWTPITDKAVEGVFLNSNTRAVVPFLPFLDGQPNGGTSENAVELLLENYIGYRDTNADNPGRCVSCTLKSSTTFRLRGLCQSSHMGKYIKKHFKSLFPPDTTYVAINGNVRIEYSGIVASNMW